MICGTMVLEDLAIHYRRNEDGEVEYMVQDGPTGQTAKVTCGDQAFGAALALAMGGDEIAGSAELYPLAEKAMPKVGDVVYDPNFEPTREGLKYAVQAVRWIP